MIIEWDDIDIVAKFELKDGVMVDFICYEIIGYEPDNNGNATVKLFDTGLEGLGNGTTTKIDEAVPLIKGEIRWDACSHVYFGVENGYIHICGKETWIQVTECLNRVFKQAGEMLKQGFNDDYF